MIGLITSPLFLLLEGNEICQSPQSRFQMKTESFSNNLHRFDCLIPLFDRIHLADSIYWELTFLVESKRRSDGK